MKIKSRFKDHILIETHLKEGIYNLDIWDFKSPTSEYMERIRFINSCGTLTVNGDFGNWVFCREFHPSRDGRVSRGYWDEKLEIASVQESKKFSIEETQELLKDYIEEYADNYETISDEVWEWFELLYDCVFDQIEYEEAAYRQKPDHIDYEDVPYGTKRHIWLDIIYDAFNEICKRYE